MSHILIITGMHRSGTSLVANLLQNAGVNLGEKLLAPNHQNPRGFFEDLDLYHFHEDVLHARGLNILVTRDFVFEPTPEEIQRAKHLVAQRAGEWRWGWKDPRTCLFLDFWDALLPDAHFLFIYRHPLDVLLSLVRRMEFHNLGLLEGLDAWRVYNSRIQEFYARQRERTLLCHAYGVIDRIDEFKALLKHRLNLELQLDASALDAVYHPEEFQRVHWTRELETAFRHIHPESADLYAQLNSLADLTASPSLQRRGERAALAEPSPELSAWSEFVASSSPGGRAQRRGLLLVLLARLDPNLIERFFEEHRKYMNELEEAKAWLQEQWRNWERVADERETMIQEQRAWIAVLERDKTALAEERSQWQARAEEAERRLREQQDRFVLRRVLGRKP